MIPHSRLVLSVVEPGTVVKDGHGRRAVVSDTNVVIQGGWKALLTPNVHAALVAAVEADEALARLSIGKGNGGSLPGPTINSLDVDAVQ